jgi:hypothetical protein
MTFRPPASRLTLESTGEIPLNRNRKPDAPFALSIQVSSGLVSGIGIEGLPVVGYLPAAVASAHRSKKRGLHIVFSEGCPLL